jgi:hypothetical protein
MDIGVDSMLTRSKWESFSRGYASAFNIMGGGIEMPDLSRGFERDAAALAGDWRRIGQGIRSAMDRVAADG